MSEFDRSRIALVVAHFTNLSTGPHEELSTGYFLTGELILTARHVAHRHDCTFSVRADIGGLKEADLWSDASLKWTGSSDVDAILLRTSRKFGDWSPPSFSVDMTGGVWKSAGYARAAADEDKDNRKTLPLSGSFEMSLGQGPQELSLRTDQIIPAEREAFWKGVSGAPIFSREMDGGEVFVGIITDASRVSINNLVGIPSARLLEDIGFRSSIAPSFLGALPANPFCLVLTSETSQTDLPGQVADVLAGFRLREPQFAGLHDKPIEVPVLEAVRSVENWATTIDALARADYLIADVTSFPTPEPAVMLLLGIRSVLRRGVTISVTGGQPAALPSGLPFNIQETRVLFSEAADFYDQLHLAMAEGAANLHADRNYLDLPAYHAVRAPRPESWAENDEKCILILCPFDPGYSDVYNFKLRPVIRGYTGDKLPLRMLDLRSPRLIGQALYEQMRWASWCIIDWTMWRANVFFELGVRLACSERDPLCIFSRDTDIKQGDQIDRKLDDLRQQDMLLRLFNPVIYDSASPRDALSDALQAWPDPPSADNGRPPSSHALPPAATFRMAQGSFQWQHDALLTPPHIEQRYAAEIILGKDQERRPERLVLFADNEQFDAELRSAVREKWIAAWLYMQHIGNASGISSSETSSELRKIARLAYYALGSSTEQRHVQLRKEIGNFLTLQRTLERARQGDSKNG